VIDKNIQEELLEKFIILKKDGNRDPSKYDKLNNDFGKPYKDGESLRSAMNRQIRVSKVGSNPKEDKFVDEKVLEKKTITINNNGTQTSSRLIKMNEEQSKDVDFILKAHGYDPKKWIISSTTNSEWEIQRKGGDIETLYASKITVKPRVEEKTPVELYEELLKLPTNHIPTKYTSVDPTKERNLLEITLQDLHIGKLSWGPETGENYDYKIALSRAKTAVMDILNRARDKNVERILFLLGGDTYHGDNTLMQTTSGTILDSDVRWQKMFLVGTKLLVELIEEMLTIAPVDVITILGNHSIVTEMHSQMFLSAWFRNDPRVNVELEMTPRKYYEYGKCLIGFTHGDKEAKRISGVMQIEEPQAWGRTTYREIHAGHLHSEQTTETNGIIIRNISSVTGNDSWHTQKGFIGAQKKLQAFLWNKNKGLVEIWNSPILEEPFKQQVKKIENSKNKSMSREDFNQ